MGSPPARSSMRSVAGGGVGEREAEMGDYRFLKLPLNALTVILFHW